MTRGPWRSAAAISALAAGLLALVPGPARAQTAPPYVIDAFDVTMDLAADGAMIVQERIAVTFNQERHGIYRRIPVDYDTGRGTVRRLDVEVLGVTDASGDAYGTKVTHEGSDVRIRIGDADVLVAPGSSLTYVISYRARGMINWFDAAPDWEPFAELYWNVTGDAWDTTIRSSSAVVTFPPQSGGEGVRVRTFAGPYGSRSADTVLGLADGVPGTQTATTISLAEDRATVIREAPLAPYEGLTVVLDLPAAAIQRPTVGQRLLDLGVPNLGCTSPIWSFFGMLGAWWFKGRDPDSGPVAVQYDAPDGLSGPEAGALIDERVDPRDVAAGVIRLAVLGYLEVEPTVKKGFFTERKTADLHLTDRQPGPELTAFDRALLERLQDVGTDIGQDDLRSDVATHLADLNEALYQTLVDRGYYDRAPGTTKILWALAGLVGVVALGVLFAALAPLRAPVPAAVGAMVGLLPVVVFSRAMSRRTKSGAAAHRKVLGLE
ncbi:MAG: DUF2207 domain-containing protein, partial [Anaerolineae bacterium]